jgi:hypothetical protein
MKIVREHIDEKFTEDSDPIRDMGIGMKQQYEKWVRDSFNKQGRNFWPQPFEDDVNLALQVCTYYGKQDFVEYLLNLGADIHDDIERPLRNAAYKKHINLGVFLVKNGANLNAALKHCRINFPFTYHRLLEIKNEINKIK